jgi:NodT family efflux transporter outer membrane factor (OMF) lipoprotein
MRGVCGSFLIKKDQTWPRRKVARHRPALVTISIALCSALAMLAASGCTPWGEYKNNGFKVGPNYHTPHADVSDHWIDSTDKRLSSEEPDLSHWWTTFNDPILNDLISTAVQQNLTLKEACFRILQERAALAIAVGNLFPQTQQAVGSYTRNAVSVLAANQGFLGGGFPGTSRFFNNWDLGFNLAWELDFWGRFRRAIEAAQDELEASVFDYDDVLVTLLGDIGSTYVEIRTLQQQIAYVRENIKIQNESLEIAQARFAGGLTSDLDSEQAMSQLAQTEALIPQFEKQLRSANDRLCVLMGIPTIDLMPDLGDKDIPSASPDAVVGIPCDLLMRRPDIRRAERLAAAQCAAIGIAESDLYPAISVNGTVGFDAQRFTDLFKNRSLQGAVGPGFQWNVLNYGRLINNVHLQEAKFCELVTHYRNTVLKANSEAEDGIVQFLQSQLQTKDMQRSVDAAAKAVDLSITQYKGGLVDFNRVAVLEQNLVQQQDLLAQAQGDIALGLVHLYRALGGGWERRCEGIFDSPLPTDAEASGVSQNAEDVPAGKGSSSKDGQIVPQTPGPGIQPPPVTKPQTPAPRRSLQLPGPAEAAPPPKSSTKAVKVPKALNAEDSTGVHFHEVSAPLDEVDRQNFKTPLKLKHSNQETSFDWTEEGGPLPPPNILPRQAQNSPRFSRIRDQDEAESNYPDADVGDAAHHMRAILHAGMLPEDKGETEWQR